MGAAFSLGGGLDGDVQANARGEGDEHFETELLPFASDQIGDAGLTDPEELGRLRLRQLLGFDDFPQLGH